MRAGPLFGTSSQPTRATIGAGLKQPSRALLAGLLVDAQGERLTPSHAVKKGRRYRYYVSAALITDAGTDRAQGWRLAAREIGWAVMCRWVMTPTSARSWSTLPRPRPCAASSRSIVRAAACVGSRKR